MKNCSVIFWRLLILDPLGVVTSGLSTDLLGPSVVDHNLHPVVSRGDALRIAACTELLLLKQLERKRK